VEQGAQGLRISQLMAENRFASRVLEQLRGEAAGWQRLGRWGGQPLPSQLRARREGEGEGRRVDGGARRKIQAERDARAHRRRLEGRGGAEGHARGDRDERRRRPFVQTGEHATAELALRL